MKREAIFSKGRKYRYWLKRQWARDMLSVNFICLNPSYADEIEDDRMVTKCIKQAQILGFGSIEMTNIFAYIETIGNNIYKIADPVGKENDYYLFKTAKKCDNVIVAWGNKGCHNSRAETVLKMLEKLNIKLYCLTMTSAGQPHHPGRLGYCDSLKRYYFKNKI